MTRFIDDTQELNAHDSATKVESVRAKVLALKERLGVLDTKCMAAVEQEIGEARVVKHRVDYLVVSGH